MPNAAAANAASAGQHNSSGRLLRGSAKLIQPVGFVSTPYFSRFSTIRRALAHTRISIIRLSSPARSKCLLEQAIYTVPRATACNGMGRYQDVSPGKQTDAATLHNLCIKQQAAWFEQSLQLKASFFIKSPSIAGRGAEARARVLLQRDTVRGQHGRPRLHMQRRAARHPHHCPLHRRRLGPRQRALHIHTLNTRSKWRQGQTGQNLAQPEAEVPGLT